MGAGPADREVLEGADPQEGPGRGTRVARGSGHARLQMGVEDVALEVTDETMTLKVRLDSRRSRSARTDAEAFHRIAPAHGHCPRPLVTGASGLVGTAFGATRRPAAFPSAAGTRRPTGTRPAERSMDSTIGPSARSSISPVRTSERVGGLPTRRLDPDSRVQERAPRGPPQGTRAAPRGAGPASAVGITATGATTPEDDASVEPIPRGGRPGMEAEVTWPLSQIRVVKLRIGR